MKTNIFRLFVILFVLGSMPACEKTDPVPQEQEPGEITLNKKAQEIIDADQEFAFELFREICSLSEEDNIMISPLSVSYALGMTLNGAAGTTLDAFYDVLHFGELTNMEINESYRDLMGQLVKLDAKVEFSIANSIWYKLGYNVLEEFITTNQDYFDAAVRELDFLDPGAVDIINGWIEEKTNDKIQDMLDFIPSGVVMYLINAVYFNATWKYQFDKDETYEGDFYQADGSTGKANFMKLKGGFSHMVNEDFAAVELPYGDSSFSMVAMLPAEGKDLDDLIGQMDIDQWNSVSGQFSMKEVQIDLPKFKYEFKDLLNDPLINLGLDVAFSFAADFSRITPGGGIYISRVIHQTFIDVQEEGTEAAAATIVEMRETSVPQIPVFKADKPFLYIIKENSTGAIIFMGKVGMPGLYADQ